MTRARVLAGFVTTINATNDLSVGIVTASDGNFSGDLTVTGTLTYEDVTNIDSVGLVTARSGLVVSGVSTFGAAIDVNSTSNFQGDATFQGNVDLGDNDKIRLGDLPDMEISLLMF